MLTETDTWGSAPPRPPRPRVMEVVVLDPARLRCAVCGSPAYRTDGGPPHCLADPSHPVSEPE